jgi:hypothetical protein
MMIWLGLEDLTPEVKGLYLENKLTGGMSIDYALNQLLSYVGEEEIVIFDFTPICKLDNRYTGYQIYQRLDGIMIEITGG